MSRSATIKSVKQRLLTAAAEVFFEKGYPAARISDVVSCADVARGTFYLYFKSKKAVFVSLVGIFFDELLAETLGQNAASGLKDANAMRHQIRNIWRTILVYCRTRPQVAALVLQEATALPKAERGVLAANYARAADALVHYNRETRRRGITRSVDPHLTACVVIGMVERAVHYAVFVAAETDIDEIVADLVTIELDGLLAPEQKTEKEGT